MSNAYTLVQWNAHKRVYDLCLVGAVALYLICFIVAGKLAYRGQHAISDPILLMRALGTGAILLLHIILCIGPLARLSPRFAPLLYNRRHLGVTMFLLALGHAALATLFYGAFGDRNPALAVLADNPSFASISGFPFEVPGFIALLILFLLAATSHDFWLANLGPSLWKSLHMLVYAAYALLIVHVALGVLQSESSPLYPALLALGIVTVATLHIAAGRRELRADSAAAAVPDGPTPLWLDVASIDEIPPDRAKVVCLRGRERVAVFRYGGKVSAVANVCAHQGGPLGEGKVIDGCITCPWHGYQYRPDSGQSPPPYTERIATYQVRIENRRILLNPDPFPPGTRVEPAAETGASIGTPISPKAAND